MKDAIKVRGSLQIVVTDGNGEVKDAINVDNLIVNAGLSHITSRMATASSNTMSHMALGTSGAAASASQTALGAEVGRVALSNSDVSGSSVSYTATFNAGTATGAITEAGLFNATSGGTMLARTAFPVVNKGASDAMAITWTVTLTAN